MMTSEQLGIPEEWRSALAEVLVMLESGELRHIPKSDFDRCQPYGSARPKWFNMSAWNCGSVCCIGGAAEIVGGFMFKDHHESLANLFYPDIDNEPFLTSYDAITPEQAARALRNYLETGAARWAEVLV